jgi:hypothetical protein
LYNTSTHELHTNTSDDRVKDNETFITNATKTLMKLKPQTYDKRSELDPTAIIGVHESGLMAQDIYYDTPELRHLVFVPLSADPTDEKPPAPSDDPRDDPDYSAWGPDIANYDQFQLIPYLIRGFQEIVTELPRAKKTVADAKPGLIVSSFGHRDQLQISDSPNDPKWFGVVSDQEGLIDTKGETRVWVTGPNLTIGDLITTSDVPGHAQKQDGTSLQNYTVAKVLQFCDFTEPAQTPILRQKRELVDVPYYIAQQETVIGKSDYDRIAKERNRRKETETAYRKIGEDDSITQDQYDALPDEPEPEPTSDSDLEDSTKTKLDYEAFQKTTYYRVQNFETKYPRASHPITEIRQEMVDVPGEWEETGEFEPIYTLVDHGTYKAALVSCKLI